MAAIPPDDAHYLEEYIRDRIAALREDMRNLEVRLDARIALNSTRLANLESWKDQMLGASKAGRVIWVAVVSMVIGLFTLWTWIYEHVVRHN